ncbi:cytochrome P450 3A21-like [Octopus sinensis]|uniref:Cytochrome P450 3A21-like n=1 Tax=Octopus sinensis TaxID=2607531 RepID=A0A6P7U6K1_9MOLL|nr:cytochrome P450 3A21-like [Octopus sinensis]
MFLGNLIEMGKRNIHFCFSHWQKIYGDTFGVYLGCFPQVVFHDPKALEEIYVKNFSNFTNRPDIFNTDEYFDDMIPMARDEHWKFLRVTLSPCYTGKQLKGMIMLMKKPTENLLKIFSKFSESGQECNVQDAFSKYTLDNIAAVGFGVELNSSEQGDHPLVKNALSILNKQNELLIGLLSTVAPGLVNFLSKLKVLDYFNKRTNLLAEFSKQLLKTRRQNLNPNGACKDFLEIMLEAQVAGNENLTGNGAKDIPLENISDWKHKRGITDSEIIAQCIIFFMAGYETTASTLTFFARCMAFNPDIQENVYKEIMEVVGDEYPTYESIQQLKYLEMCMAESLRLYPLISILQRECKKDCVIKGVKIPAKMTVVMPIRSLHYDERYWTDPTKFDPERFSEEGKARQTPFTYTPFGGGPRICIGMRLAKLQFKVAVVQMMRKYRLVTTEKTEDPIEYASTDVLSAKNGVWLKFEPRKSL